jgi:ABC-type multidrug transport system, permease component
MKQFFSFVQKEFWHILRDRRTMLIVLGMPVVQILLFGFAINMDVENIRTAVYDPSNDAASQQIIRRISAHPYFIVKDEASSMSEIDDLLRKGNIDVAIIFEKDFQSNLIHSGESQIQILTDASDPNFGTIAASYATAVVSEYQKEMMGIQRIPYAINVESKLLFNPELRSSYTFVPGVMGLVLMLICAIMTSISIVREKEHGTMEVLYASPLKHTTVLFAKATPYLVLSVINLISILLLSVFVLDVPIKGSLTLLVLTAILYIFLSLSLGLLISTLAQTQVVAVLISGLGLILPLLMLSGMIFPIDNMPPLLQWVSAAIPARWYISIVRKIMIEGLGFISVVKEISILIGMCTVLISLSLISAKNRLK